MDQEGAVCRIVVRGRLTPAWNDYCGPLESTVEVLEEYGASTILSGTLPDLAAVMGLVMRFQNLGLRVLALSYQEQAGSATQSTHDATFLPRSQV